MNIRASLDLAKSQVPIMLRSGEVLDVRAGRLNQLRRAQKRRCPSILDSHKEFLVAQMERGLSNAERMLRDLCKRGDTGQIRIVRAFMQPYRPMTEAIASVRFETEPGHRLR